MAPIHFSQVPLSLKAQSFSLHSLLIKKIRGLQRSVFKRVLDFGEYLGYQMGDSDLSGIFNQWW